MIKARLSVRLLLALLPVFLFGQTHEDWSYNLSLYEVNLRQYSESGSFQDFSGHLDRLQAMGAGILWFMPIHPIGEQNRLGNLGSYYSVKNYLDVNPEHGTLDDFKTLVEDIHSRGMYVIIDWVANHTSWDNDLTREHSEWYVQENGQFIPPPGTNWSDVIELDFEQPGLRRHMIDAMKFWITETGIDGFRCDAVSFVPLNFWTQAIEELKSVKPDLFLLAEGDGTEWYTAGFDMTFGWGLYGFGGGVLKRIADGENNAGHLNSFLAAEKRSYGTGGRLYFTSNHDENSWHGTTTELFGGAAGVFAVISATIPGMPLFYSGQEAGLDKRLLFFDKDQIGWQEHPNMGLYTTLLHLKRENPALWNGGQGGSHTRIRTSAGNSVYAFLRERDDNRVLVAANLTDQNQDFTLSGSSYFGDYNNVFSGETKIFEAGSSLTLPAWGYAVYESEIDSGIRSEPAPSRFELGQNYPNPFNPETRIPFTVSKSSTVSLSIIDAGGRIVRTVELGEKEPGSHSVRLDASGLPSGVYLYLLQAGNQMITKRMLVVR